MRTLSSLLLAALCFTPVTRAADDDAPVKPAATAPATKPAAQAKVSPDAQKVLDDIKSAYAGLTVLDLAGAISFEGDIAGKKQTENDTFAATFAAPNKFRHEMKGNMVAGSTGEKAYAISLEENTYVQKDAPKDRTWGAAGPKAVWEVLTMQNPSLAMALSADAGRQLINGTSEMTAAFAQDMTADDVTAATEVTKVDDLKIGDATFAALKVTNPLAEFTIAVDPQSHLLRLVKVDQRKLLEKIGQPDVKSAQFTFDYTTSNRDAKPADNQFAWAPPAGAKELTAPPARGAGGTGESASALLNKPAPDFKLAGLDGKDVKLSEQKGHVVIVDFWATWCGPCVESLPKLNKLYEEKKADGVKVFAVSVDQDKAKVPPFVEAKKLSVTVLYDNEEQSAAEKYGVTGIPQTVVIDKEGVVRKVFVGAGPGTEEALTKAVEELMK